MVARPSALLSKYFTQSNHPAQSCKKPHFEILKYGTYFTKCSQSCIPLSSCLIFMLFFNMSHQHAHQFKCFQIPVIIKITLQRSISLSIFRLQSYPSCNIPYYFVHHITFAITSIALPSLVAIKQITLLLSSQSLYSLLTQSPSL